MRWLNYHHLFYFWTVAREGSLTGAAAKLRLAPSTLSGQIHMLESFLGQRLLVRQGRRLTLTEVGRLVSRQADEIFALGQDLLESVESGAAKGQQARLDVGVADVVPKLIARRLLQPGRELPGGVKIVCREDKPDRLLGDLASHALDIVISDAPVPPGSHVKAFSHLLGESQVGFFGAGELARKYKRKFPASLDGAPMLLPTENTSLRRSLEEWFAAVSVRPKVVAEFEDGALLNAFGQDGAGVFPVPLAIRRDVEAQYRVQLIGVAGQVRERFYALSVDRRITHPAVVAITRSARKDLFA
jgi:LysR family transcriptional regulator, transcriptional activator of nhaA